MKFKLFSKREGSLFEKIADAAFTIHKLLGYSTRLGFLINFNVLLVKNGINKTILKPLWLSGRTITIEEGKNEENNFYCSLYILLCHRKRLIH